MVQDGNTVVLGGLKKDDKVATSKGFPILMDMPVLGRMFRRDQDEFNETEIIIFLTPHIVSGADEYEDIFGTIKPFKSYSTD